MSGSIATETGTTGSPMTTTSASTSSETPITETIKSSPVTPTATEGEYDTQLTLAECILVEKQMQRFLSVY